jgi:hypothetical protein
VLLLLPGLVAPVSVVPSRVPLAVPALGVMPAEKPVWGDAASLGLSLAANAQTPVAATNVAAKRIVRGLFGIVRSFPALPHISARRSTG